MRYGHVAAASVVAAVIAAVAGAAGLVPSQTEAPEPRGEKMFVEKPLEAFAEEQQQIFREHEATRDADVRARDAYILAEIWKQGHLDGKIKDALVEKYYRPVLFQIRVAGNRTYHFVVRCHQTFPFPDVWIKFTPAAAFNGEVAWAPERPQTETALSNNNMLLTSLSGGALGGHEITPGDALVYSITLTEEKEKQVVWRKTLRTNTLRVQPLED